MCAASILANVSACKRLPTLFERTVSALKDLPKEPWQYLDKDEAISALVSNDFFDALRNTGKRERIAETDIFAAGYTPMQKRIPLPQGFTEDILDPMLGESLGSAYIDTPKGEKTRKAYYEPEDDHVRIIALEPEAFDRAVPSFIRNIQLMADEAKKGWKVVKLESGKEEYERSLGQEQGRGRDWALYVALNSAMPKTVRITNVFPDGREIPVEPGGRVQLDPDQIELIDKRLTGDKAERKEAGQRQRALVKSDQDMEKEILEGTRRVMRIPKTPENTAALKDLIGLQLKDRGTPG